jgi:hypothetical protein
MVQPGVSARDRKIALRISMKNLERNFFSILVGQGKVRALS